MSGRFAKLALALALVAGGAALVWTIASRSNAGAAPAPEPRVADPQAGAIACLGRIQPEDGVVRLSARSISGQPSIVASVLVKEGDPVTRGQVVATLNSREQLEAAAGAADARVAVARSRLNQVRAGAKPADLQAQRADIERLEADLADAERDLTRFESLFTERVVAQAELDARRLRVASVAKLLAQARARLESLAEVRGVDVAYAQAELRSAMAAAAQARAELDQSEVRSPIDGHVILIHAWPGEEVRFDGIMEIGKTDRMYAFAEVDESDVRFLRVGQRATVTGSALSEPLTGVVEFIASKVTRNEEHNLDPVAPSDARVVQARILLDDPARAVRLINAQVTVLIAR